MNATTGPLILNGDGTSRCLRCGCVLPRIPRDWRRIRDLGALMGLAMRKHTDCTN